MQECDFSWNIHSPFCNRLVIGRPSENIILHFPVIGEQEKSVSVWSWRVELELESGVGDLRILCETLLFVSRFSTLSSQSNPKTQLRALGELGVRQLGIGIGFGNISTLATFTSVGQSKQMRETSIPVLPNFTYRMFLSFFVSSFYLTRRGGEAEIRSLSATPQLRVRHNRYKL